jgi:hypothetical protein
MFEHRLRLDALIDEYLAGATSVEEFGAAYSRYYLEGVPDTALSPEQFDWYGLVHEKLEWTANTATVEERQLGWMTPGEFRTWLDRHRGKGE